jgi:RNA polymerase-binding transcription factor DksA
MKQNERDHLEKRLLRERERVIKALRQLDDTLAMLEGDGELTNYPLHLADEGTDTMEQEQSFLLLSKEGRLLIEIDEALRMLYKEPDRYGLCDNCGEPIAFERLDIVPWTRLCVTCQREAELLAPPPTVPEEAA